MTPRRIAYLLKIFPKLSETFIAGELAELRRRGIALRILSLRPPSEDLRHEIVADAGLDELCCYEPARFAAILREFKPQIIHAHFAAEATAAARDLAAEHGIPFSFTAHGYDIHLSPPPDFRERAAAARAVVTVSEANARHIAATFDVPRSSISVIACGVDTGRFCPDPAPAGTDQPPLIVCVARHVGIKNLGLLLDVCALLRDRGVEFHCVMVGAGPITAELEALCEHLRLRDRITMTGAATQSEVLQWWRRATVGVLTSANEGLPVSLMEAAACGVPVVAPAVGGIPELVEHGVTGLVVPPGDAAAFADGLVRLFGDPALRWAMGAAARRRAEERFSVRLQVDRLLALWSDVLSR